MFARFLGILSLILVVHAAIAQGSSIATSSDLRAAETVAKSFLELNFSGKFVEAAKLVDPDSLSVMKSRVLAMLQQAKQSGQNAYIESMGIHQTTSDLEKLSPSEFYVSVIAKMSPVPPGVTVSVVSSKQLADQMSAVEISVATPSNPQPNKATVKLKLIRAQWMIQLGA